ncbi:uncharacterized protein LOC113558560 [Rhopalosiphum maidis]|uniref:uncharacterized protein LOC113558560 n=1 Tax=Rhopalosiphum maidis TaxID=43146 RepID=UPI000EFE1F87|nr:uncharacterized protein LOC113558560 [Rhopalosiphum maidis]
MMSIVVLIITIISSIGTRADLQTNMFGVLPGRLSRCPPLESAEYEVTTMISLSLKIGGCAYINYNSSDIIKQSFNLWFNGVQNYVQSCRDQGMEHFNLYCLTKSLWLPDDANKGPTYIKLYDEAFYKGGRLDYRCALYETVDGNASAVRLAVSGNTSCHGLLHMLSHSSLIPKNIPEFNEGSMLLIFNKTKLGGPITSQPIDKQYEKPAVQVSDKRDGDGKRGSVMSIDSTNTSETQDKNTSRQPLSIEVMQQLLKFQFRRRRSATSNSFSDITGYSWIQGFGRK